MPFSQTTPPPDQLSLREPRKTYHKELIDDLVFYITELSKDEFSELHYAILMYDLFGVDEPPAGEALQMLYRHAKKKADFALGEYQKTCERNRKNATKDKPLEDPVTSEEVRADIDKRLHGAIEALDDSRSESRKQEEARRLAEQWAKEDAEKQK